MAWFDEIMGISSERGRVPAIILKLLERIL